MVKRPSLELRKRIHQAVLTAEQYTSADMAVVIAPMSDEYRAVVLVVGFAFGSCVALLLWHLKIATAFPELLGVQLLAALLFLLLPPLRQLSAGFAPAHLKKHKAAHRAAVEYLHAASHLPASGAFVLLYISLAERYVHIHISRLIREKIPDREWDAVVATLTSAMKSEGLEQAVTKAVAHAGEMLKGPFPRNF